MSIIGEFKRNLDVVRYKHSAYWFAVGVIEEQVRVYKSVGVLAGAEEPVDLSQEFSEYVERQATDYYDPSHPRFSLSSIPDQWRDFVKECREANADDTAG